MHIREPIRALWACKDLGPLGGLAYKLMCVGQEVGDNRRRAAAVGNLAFDLKCQKGPGPPICGDAFPFLGVVSFDFV